jgi:hypothetical protein
MFYISAMRQSANDRTLVQTVHNTYIEGFYDFGFLITFYYGAILTPLIHAIMNLRRSEKTLKIFGITILAISMFLSIYGLTDGIRVTILIPFFSILAFYEGIHRLYEDITAATLSVGTVDTLSMASPDDEEIPLL